MPRYFRTTAGAEIAAINDRLEQRDYTEHLKRALQLLDAAINDLLLSQGVTFPLLAPDGSPTEPSYSFINQPFLGISRDPLLGLYIQNRQSGPSGVIPTTGVTIEFITVSGGPNPVGLYVVLGAGYVGSGPTIGLKVANPVAGTGAWTQGGLLGNSALQAITNAATTGDNTGAVGYAENTTGRAIGLWGAVPFDVGTQSIGVGGVGSSDGKGIGGYFTLRPGTNVPSAISASLVADNPAGLAFDLFVCRKSGSNVFRIGTTGHSHEPNSRKITTSAFNKTANTTLADVTGLTIDLTAGRTYHFRATLFVDADIVGGGKYAISLTSAPTSIIYQINALDNTTNAFVITARHIASGGTTGQAGATALFVIIEGSVVVNATATISVQFAQNAANGTSTVLAGSTFTVEDMNA